MKGNPNVINLLNSILADELTAINQYMVHAGMCDNWGYGKLHDAIEHRAIEEMKHAEAVIDRILFLEGNPTVSVLNKITIGSSVEVQLRNDHSAESDAIGAYNSGIRLCLESADNGTRELLEDNLEDEERHIDWLEAQLDQIEQMGIQNYLTEQLP